MGFTLQTGSFGVFLFWFTFRQPHLVASHCGTSPRAVRGLGGAVVVLVAGPQLHCDTSRFHQQGSEYPSPFPLTATAGDVDCYPSFM